MMLKRGIALLVGLAFSLTVLYFGLASLIASITISTGEPRLPFLVFGALDTILGLANLSLLVLAWRSPSSRVPKAAAIVGSAVVIFAYISSLDYGGVNGLEFIAIVGLLAVPAVANWYAVRFLARTLLA